MSQYKIPANDIENEELIKGSRFITRIKQVETVLLAKTFINELKNAYPDASHHCWTYVIGNPNSTTLISCSDDGEPSGTAGKPMLHVLQHAMIGDVVIVCTRYFGGTKLGTGGLARAYGGGVKLALDLLKTEEKIEYCHFSFFLDYAQQKDFEHLISAYQSNNLLINYSGNLEVKIDISDTETLKFKCALDNLCKGNIKWLNEPD